MVLPIAVASGFLLALLAPFPVGVDRRIALAAWLAAPLGLLVLAPGTSPDELAGEYDRRSGRLASPPELRGETPAAPASHEEDAR